MGKTWLDAGQSVKAELMGFADIIDVGLRGRTEPQMTPELLFFFLFF